MPGIHDNRAMTYKEFAAIKSQLVTELQLSPKEWLQVLGPNIDSTGNPQNLLSTSGYVTETNSGNINTYTTYTATEIMATSPLTASAAGVSMAATSAPWFPMTPVQITADANGAIAATQLVAAGAAGKKQDVVCYFMVNTTGTYDINWIEATGGAKGPTVPAMDFENLSLVAGFTYGLPYGFRMMNTTAATNVGIKDEGNTGWPNNAIGTFWGFYRSV